MSSNARKGLEALQDMIDNNSGGDFSPTPYFMMSNGETRYVRFLTDDKDLIAVDVHQRVPRSDNNSKSRYGNVVCRRDPIIGDENCPICDTKHRPTGRIYGLVVVREPVYENEEYTKPDQPGRIMTRKKITGFKVVTEEKVVDGEETIVPVIEVVCQGVKNFFSTIVGYAMDYGTLTDRDYKIKRVGDGTDTQYVITPVEPIELDLNEILEFNTIDLEDHLKGLGSSERIERIFTSSGGSSSSRDDDEGDSPASSKRSSGSSFDEVRERMKSRSYEG